MAVPKRRISKTRGRKRRTHIQARSVQITACRQCQAMIPSHTVCPRCGFYSRLNRSVLQTED